MRKGLFIVLFTLCTLLSMGQMMNPARAEERSAYTFVLNEKKTGYELQAYDTFLGCYALVEVLGKGEIKQ